jgi:chemotaxis protein MotB
MSDDSTRPIVVKRVKKSAAGAHGGAWKLAYADFVTAMMAFFLLMWLLGSTAKGDLEGIAEFFQNPLKLANDGGSGVGDASSIINGGGQDLTRSSGQVKQGDVEAENQRISMREKRLEFERRERQSLENLKRRIEKMIDDSPQLLQFKNQLLLDITTEGLRIQIVDELNRPMFDLSSDQLKPYTRSILREIGAVLNDVPNRLSLAGHTDAAQFAGGARGFSNWELSANRANASRRELVAGGMDDLKVLRVEGLSSSVLFDPNDPLNPINRRISIIVLNKRTEMGILEEGAEYEVYDE